MLAKILSAAALMVLALPTHALAGPAIATRYTEPGRLKERNFTQEKCLARAEAVIAAEGYAMLERTGQSRYGTAGDTTAAIRCIVDKDIVLMIVSGPSRPAADEGAARLFRAFEAGR
jgi:hypothetical protein